jgi:hypothetical protein
MDRIEEYYRKAPRELPLERIRSCAVHEQDWPMIFAWAKSNNLVWAGSGAMEDKDRTSTFKNGPLTLLFLIKHSKDLRLLRLPDGYKTCEDMYECTRNVNPIESIPNMRVLDFVELGLRLPSQSAAIKSVDQVTGRMPPPSGSALGGG